MLLSDVLEFTPVPAIRPELFVGGPMGPLACLGPGSSR